LTWPYLCFERLPDHFTEEGLRFRLQREGNTAAFISVAVSAVLCWKRLLQARPVFSSSAKETGPLPGLNIEQEVVARSLFQCFAQSPLSKACVILGKSGTGKTRLLLEFVSRYSTENCDKKVLLACPTGKLVVDLSTRVASCGLFPVCDVDTCHRAFGLELDGGTFVVRARDLKVYGLVIIDELSMISSDAAQRILALSKRFSFEVVFGGDFRQLPPPNVPLSQRICRSAPFWSCCYPFTLQTQVRIQDVVHQNFADIIRVRPPSFDELVSFVSPLALEPFFNLKFTPTSDALHAAVVAYPAHVWLCATNEGVSKVNKIRSALFVDDALSKVRSVEVFCIVDGFSERIELIRDMPVLVLENINIDDFVVNGVVYHVVFVRQLTLVLRNDVGEIRLLSAILAEDGSAFFPVRLAFAQTVHKSQGGTLENVVLWIDTFCSRLLEGLAYVAFTRARRCSSIKVFGCLRTAHFVPTLVYSGVLCSSLSVSVSSLL